MTSRCLVTGGAGFIGSHLVARLVSEGADVTVLDDLTTGDAAAVHPRAHLVEGDVCDAATVRTVTEGTDLVFHLAAHRSIARSVDDPAGTDRANSQGTVTVLGAAADAGVRRVVYASSSSVYGDPSTTPVCEDAPALPLSPYAVSKLAGEHYCRVFAHLFGVHTVALRYFNVYGPGQPSDGRYATVIPLFVDALLGGRRPVVFGDGTLERDFTYVDDVIDATLAAASAPGARPGSVYNVGAGDPCSLNDLLGVLGKLLGMDPDPVHREPRPGDVSRTHADVSAAERDLDYRRSVRLDEGLARTIEWFRADGRAEEAWKIREGAGRRG